MIYIIFRIRKIGYLYEIDNQIGYSLFVKEWEMDMFLIMDGSVN